MCFSHRNRRTKRAQPMQSTHILSVGDASGLAPVHFKFSVGQRVLAKFHGIANQWFAGRVVAQNDADGTYFIGYDDGDEFDEGIEDYGRA
mgnify:CR=1 FL=1